MNQNHLSAWIDVTRKNVNNGCCSTLSWTPRNNNGVDALPRIDHRVQTAKRGRSPRKKQQNELVVRSAI